MCSSELTYHRSQCANFLLTLRINFRANFGNQRIFTISRNVEEANPKLWKYSVKF